jgi:hypothetical protein
MTRGRIVLQSGTPGRVGETSAARVPFSAARRRFFWIEEE